jgi:regulator of sirC expression with transglutaminase-like and TPR domain
MNFQFQAITPLAYFESLVQSDTDLPLLEAAASLAQDEDAGLDVQQVLADVDRLLARLQQRIPEAADGLTRLALLNQFFYTDLGFSGNVNNYYAHENSYLSEVLRTRKGIPISLAVIWLELARGLGLRVQGVSFPGHFLVKVAVDQGLVVLDPMSGESLGLDTLGERLAPFRRFDDVLEEGDAPLELHLQACPPRDLLARMLHNLKEIFRSQDDDERLLAVMDRLVVLLPEAWTEWRDRGLLHAQMGQHAQAIDDLSRYLEHEPMAADADYLSDRLAELKAL